MSMNKHLFPLLLISCFCIFPLYAGIERYADDMFPDTDNEALTAENARVASDFRDTSLSPEERAELLLKELTLPEKISLMMDVSKPVERLGIYSSRTNGRCPIRIVRQGIGVVGRPVEYREVVSWNLQVGSRRQFGGRNVFVIYSP